MAILLPGVSQRLLPQAATQPRIVPWSVILHTVVGNPTLDAFFTYWSSNPGGQEGHLGVRVVGRLRSSCRWMCGPTAPSQQLHRHGGGDRDGVWGGVDRDRRQLLRR